MKRSEMVSRMSGALKSMVNQNIIDRMGHEYVVKHLLAIAEMGGMLPPHIYGFEKDEEVQSYEWEPEDD